MYNYVCGAARSYRQAAHTHTHTRRWPDRWHCGKGSSRGQWDVRVGSLSFCVYSPFQPIAADHMSDHSTALLPFSTLATYAPDGDQDTEFMAELQKGQRDRTFRRAVKCGRKHTMEMKLRTTHTIFAVCLNSLCMHVQIYTATVSPMLSLA